MKKVLLSFVFLALAHLSFADDWLPFPIIGKYSIIRVTGRTSAGDGLQRLFSPDSPISIQMSELVSAYTAYTMVANILGFQTQMGEELKSVRWIPLDLHNVPPAEALDAIGHASHTRWEAVTDGNTTMLRVSPAGN
jgi:hypothetical protein